MIYLPLAVTNTKYGSIADTRNDQYVNPAPVTQAWLDGEITTDELAREHIRLIEVDVATGKVPWDVADVAELESYADVNEYIRAVCGSDMTHDGSQLARAVRDAVQLMLSGSTVRLRARGPAELRSSRRRAARPGQQPR